MKFYLAPKEPHNKLYEFYKGVHELLDACNIHETMFL